MGSRLSQRFEKFVGNADGKRPPVIFSIASAAGVRRWAIAQPIFDPEKDGIHTLAVAARSAARVEQLLEELVIVGKMDDSIEAKAIEPELQRGTYRLSGERRHRMDQ